MPSADCTTLVEFSAIATNLPSPNSRSIHSSVYGRVTDVHVVPFKLYAASLVPLAIATNLLLPARTLIQSIAVAFGSNTSFHPWPVSLSNTKFGLAIATNLPLRPTPVTTTVTILFELSSVTLATLIVQSLVASSPPSTLPKITIESPMA